MGSHEAILVPENDFGSAQKNPRQDFELRKHVKISPTIQRQPLDFVKC